MTVHVTTTRTARVGRGLTALLATAALLAGCAAGDGDADDEVAADDVAAEETPSVADEPSEAAVEETATEDAGPPLVMYEEAPEPMPIPELEGWELVWNDEFDGPEIDPANWTHEIGGWGWGNGEAQYYTDAPENSRIHDGVLVIEARQEKVGDNYYTSARMITQGLQEFEYGRFEARMKVPEGAGMWPAFWMLGADFEHDAPDEANRWPNVGEIDVMEYIGREPDLVVGTVHGPGYAGAMSIGKYNRQDFEIADDWHTYAVEWEPGRITWFFDGEQYHEFTPEILNGREWVFDGEFFMILNLALGGQFPGPIGLDVEFPKQLLVDHVRVWQREGGVEGGGDDA